MRFLVRFFVGIRVFGTMRSVTLAHVLAKLRRDRRKGSGFGGAARRKELRIFVGACPKTPAIRRDPMPITEALGSRIPRPSIITYGFSMSMGVVSSWQAGREALQALKSSLAPLKRMNDSTALRFQSGIR